MLAGAITIIWSTSKKGTLQGKDETIKMQSDYIAALERKKTSLEKDNADYIKKNQKLEGEVNTLRDIANQTPETIALTKQVTELTGQVAMLVKSFDKLTKHLAKDGV